MIRTNADNAIPATTRPVINAVLIQMRIAMTVVIPLRFVKIARALKNTTSKADFAFSATSLFPTAKHAQIRPPVLHATVPNTKLMLHINASHARI